MLFRSFVMDLLLAKSRRSTRAWIARRSPSKACRAALRSPWKAATPLSISLCWIVRRHPSGAPDVIMDGVELPLAGIVRQILVVVLTRPARSGVVATIPAGAAAASAGHAAPRWCRLSDQSVWEAHGKRQALAAPSASRPRSRDGHSGKRCAARTPF